MSDEDQDNTAHRSPEQTSPVDLQVLASLRELGGDRKPDLLAQLIRIFLQDIPPRLVTLRVALQHGDVAGVDHAAHAIKGSCASLGASRMVTLCADLEKAGRAGATAESGPWLDELEAEFARVSAQLSEVIGPQQAP